MTDRVGNAGADRDNWAAKSASWVRNERIYDRIFAPFTEELLAVAGLRPEHRVLDIGCGAGTMLERAAAVGVQPGNLVGADLDPVMVAAARARVPGATVVEVDARTGPFPGASVDRVVSRFGVMFFDDPVAAFTTIRRHTAPGGTLSFVCWPREEEDMFHLGMRRAAARAEQVSGVLPSGPAPNRPGALGLADRDRILEILQRAGWARITVERLTATVRYGSPDGPDRSGVEERLAVALAGNLGMAVRRVLEPAGEWDAALSAARAELRERLDPSGCLAVPTMVWVVTAHQVTGSAESPRT